MTDKTREKLAKACMRLALASALDVAKLAMMDPAAGPSVLGGLDLTMLESYERTPTGGVKVKVLNRADTMRVAVEFLRELDGGDPMREFLAALEEVPHED